ncbi:MAG TPA: alpha-1,2-fucosyltransferase [Methanocorpusculum sp.]|nr:alpha-1,2-fucosyltransferase [Methanocorpusculum sp.]
MIIVKLMGGLGNQMFQYALGKALSLERGEEVFYDMSFYRDDRGMGKFYQNLLHLYHHAVDDKSVGPLYRGFSLHHFNVNMREEPALPHVKQYLRVLSNKTHKRVPGLSELTDYAVFDELYLSQKHEKLPEYQDIRSKNIYLCGYWQSERYFSRITDEIRHDFQITTPQSDANKSWSEIIQNSNSVSLHVRRTDYLSLGWALDAEYYHRAVEYISKYVENPVFFIFSDDIEWVKNNLEIPYDVYYVNQNGQDEAYEDMRLMSQCKHNIIANSSFSWWGAWLNQNPDKIVAAPEKWTDGTNLIEIVPERWVRL